LFPNPLALLLSPIHTVSSAPPPPKQIHRQTKIYNNLRTIIFFNVSEVYWGEREGGGRKRK
jgi:hypothetical protein